MTARSKKPAATVIKASASADMPLERAIERLGDFAEAATRRLPTMTKSERALVLTQLREVKALVDSAVEATNRLHGGRGARPQKQAHDGSL